MSLQQLSRSRELLQLRDEGYDVALLNNQLLLRNVPYLAETRAIRRGCLIVAKLNMAGGVVANPENHEMLWVGDSPRGLEGQVLPLGDRPIREEIAPNLIAEHRFSLKINNRQYTDYYEMFRTYYSTIAAPAEALDTQLAVRQLPPYVPDQDESVFNYIDTATSRAGIPQAARRLELSAVAIVGMGGTGSYILDSIAKLPVKAIHIYDGDILLTHNAFRSPGAASVAELEEMEHKTEYFARKYSAMHRHIVPHNEPVREANVEQLRAMDFVFIAIDSGESRHLIVRQLQEWGIPFVDVGMGLVPNDNVEISGLVRTTANVPGRPSPFDTYVDYCEGKDELYKRNIQTADLNMLNAALAVIKFKKLRSFYFDDQRELHSNYVVAGNVLLNESKT